MFVNDAAPLQTVLVIDDDEGIRKLLGEILKQRYQVVPAADGQEALEKLQKGRFAAIVADQNMPRMSGLDLLSKALEIDPHSARILVTAAMEAQSATEAINRARLTRYIAKPFRPLEVLEIVGGAIREHQLLLENEKLVEQLRAKNTLLEKALSQVQAQERRLEHEVVKRTALLEQAVKKLEELALRDGLTGLYNHRFFQEALEAELARCSRHSRTAGLIFLDVDHFKNYNDLHGHVAGDDLLRSLARIISNTGDDPEIRIRGRLSDIAARYGGEEFVIILPEADKAGTAVRAERVRKQVEEYPFPGREQQPGGRLTVSIGVASFPGDALTKRELIEAADNALLKAKRAGRNRVVPAGEPG